MLNNSTEHLFGGLNKIISEKYSKMKESKSVSDIDQKPKEGETQLDETPCEDKIEKSTELVQESQDYHTYMNRQDFDSKLQSLGLKSEHSGKDHEEVKDASGDLKGWWNGHTGVGYLRKDCCVPMNEDFDIPGGRQDDQTHTETGDFTTDEALKIAIQTAANRAKESGTHYHDEIIKELGSHGLDPFRNATHLRLDKVTSEMTDGKYQHHSDFGNDHVAGQLKEDVADDTKKLEESPIISRNGVEIGTEGQNVKESAEEKLEEAHLTPELTDKIEHYVHKLKPKMSEFQDKYGDSAESVMYGTATKLAKNDLGIKD